LPPALPDRYHLEVRQGRDGDIEEWLATDTALDRPVLVRFLDAQASAERSQSFLDSVRGAAAVTHNHLVAIYSVGIIDGSAYCISEWAGGMTLADRVRANEAILPEEFVPNAAGLSEALAALHAQEQIHGAIDANAIYFSAAHPAKIARFGRTGTNLALDAAGDVRDLAGALEGALTRTDPGTVAPSQVIDRLSPEVDGALREARSGSFDAGALAGALHTAPTPLTHKRPKDWSWRWLIPAGLLSLMAIVLIAVSTSLLSDSGSSESLPLPTTLPTVPNTIVPARPAPPTTVVSPVPTTQILSAVAYDPFGSGGEHDELAAAAIDGDFTTAWKTESYLDPLPRQKAGVGLVVSVQGPTTSLSATGVRDGTVWSVYWAENTPSDFAQWGLVDDGTVRGTDLTTTFPLRNGGTWLIWFVDLPAANDGTYNSTITEVRFES